MSIEIVPVRNVETGEVGTIRRDWLDNEAIVKPGILVEVDPDAKPYVPELYKSKVTAEPEEAPEEEKD